MTAAEAIALRKKMGLPQSALALELGMTTRAWQDIENGRAALRTIHALALERVALQMAASTGVSHFLPPSVLQDAVAVTRDDVLDAEFDASVHAKLEEPGS